MMFKIIVYIKYFFKTGKLAKSVRFTQRYGIAKVNGYLFVYDNPDKAIRVDTDLIKDVLDEYNM